MKVWVTYTCASALWSRGLAAANIWFIRPAYISYELTDKERFEGPFDDILDCKGIGQEEWKASRTLWSNRSLSVGEVFGYIDNKDPLINDLTEHIWNKIGEHFQNKPLGQAWKDLEKNGEALSKDFLLELDISIRLI